MPVDPRFLDPTGWRPTELQMSVTPMTTGIFWEEFLARFHGFKHGKRGARPVPAPPVEEVP